MNKLTIIGRLTHDTELRQTTTNTAVCTFTVAVERPFKDNKTGERKADFIKCVAWRNTAELIAKYFTKGNPICVEGRVENNDYTDKDGIKRYNTICQVERLEFIPEKFWSDRTASDTHPPIGVIGDFEEIISDGDVPF